MKLTHLVGVSPADSLVAGAVLRSYTFPFVAHCLGRLSDADEDDVDLKGRARGDGYGVPSSLLALYLFMAGLATYFAYHRVMDQLLIALTLRDAGPAQHATACLAMYSMFVATLLHLFRRRWKLLRRCVLCCFSAANNMTCFTHVLIII